MSWSIIKFSLFWIIFSDLFQVSSTKKISHDASQITSLSPFLPCSISQEFQRVICFHSLVLHDILQFAFCSVFSRSSFTEGQRWFCRQKPFFLSSHSPQYPHLSSSCVPVGPLFQLLLLSLYGFCSLSASWIFSHVSISCCRCFSFLVPSFDRSILKCEAPGISFVP